MAKIFIVGATGHIGGAIIDLLIATYPEASITVLVRNEQQAHTLKTKYPSITTLIGDLGSVTVLESGSNNADIVINAAPDVTHEVGITSILKGLSQKEQKGYYVHTSGAALIWDAPDGSKPAPTIWDDVADINEITSLPEDKTHRKTDQLVLSASKKVNVAVVAPVMVYGLSPSPFHPFPIVIAPIIATVRALNSAFTISAGKNRIGYVHVQDLARLYLLLISHALTPQPSESSVWGPKAYYFGTDEEISFKEFITGVVGALKEHGEPMSAGIKEVSIKEAARAAGAKGDKLQDEEADSWAVHIAISFGTDMRVRSTRARGLGWVPTKEGVVESLSETVGRWLVSEK